MKKIFFSLLLLFASTSSEASRPRDSITETKLFLIPTLAYHFASSELSDQGGSTLSHGPLGGIRFKLEKNSTFFAPDFSILEMLALDKSPLTVLSIGFTAGARLNWSLMDLYGGVSYRTPIGYKVGGTPFARFGAGWGATDATARMYFELIYGYFKETVAATEFGYPYPGVEIGVEFPLPL